MSYLSLNLALNVVGLALDEKKVAIYDGTSEVLTGSLIFQSAILSCDVVEDSELMEHPVESGFNIADSKVFNPVEINIRLCMDGNMYSPVVRELMRLYADSTKLRIKTKSRFYDNMVLQGIPHEEKPENYDRLVFDLQFKEVKIVEPKYIKLPINKLRNPENSDVQKLGDNVTNNSKNTSILKGGFNALGGLL